MDLQEIHQQVDEKLEKLDAEIERFKNNIETCDEAEQRELLEKDLATLHVIREKLVKAKGLSQQVSELKHQVENPDALNKNNTMLGLPKWLALTLLGAAGLLMAGWAWVI